MLGSPILLAIDQRRELNVMVEGQVLWDGTEWQTV